MRHEPVPGSDTRKQRDHKSGPRARKVGCEDYGGEEGEIGEARRQLALKREANSEGKAEDGKPEPIP